MISKKNDIFVHNTKRIDESMLIALDALCNYSDTLQDFFIGYFPINIRFLTKSNELYSIIVATEENRKGVIKYINSYPSMLPTTDKLILLFPDDKDLENIKTDIPFMYATYPYLEILN